MSSSHQKAKPEVGTVLEGKYRLKQEIGAGGMGVVYLAQHETIERKVAIKVLHQELASDDSVRRRFETEAKAIARLQHPNCVMLYEFGLSEQLQALFAVFEYVEGRSLESWVGHQLPLADVVTLGTKLASGMSHAHENNIIHRDLKPENIMIVGEDDDFDVKVLDFGIARIAEDDEKRTRLTKMGQMFGTPPYMSPEQVRAKLNVTYATDIYSIGVILYEMIDGDLPFLGDTPIETVMMHLDEEVPPIQRESVPQELRDVVMRCLEKEADDRFDGCDELKSALEALEIPEKQTRLGERMPLEVGQEADSQWPSKPAIAGDDSGVVLDRDDVESESDEDEMASAPTLLADEERNSQAADEHPGSHVEDVQGSDGATTEEDGSESIDDHQPAQDVTTQDLDDESSVEELLPERKKVSVVAAMVLALLVVAAGLTAVALMSTTEEVNGDDEEGAAVSEPMHDDQGQSNEGGDDDPEDKEEWAAADDEEDDESEAGDDETPSEEADDDQDASAEADEVVDEEDDEPSPPESTPESAPAQQQDPSPPAQHHDPSPPTHQDEPTRAQPDETDGEEDRQPDAITLPGGDDDEDDNESIDEPEGIGLPD